MGKRGKKRDPGKEHAAVGMFLSGATQQEIGKRIGCTRQNVNLILKGHGINRKMGGVFLRTEIKRFRDSEKREKKFLELHGLQEHEFKTPGMIILYRDFLKRKYSAQSRGIKWKLNFHEWLDIWGASGKMPFRGRGKNFYCIGRVGDAGAYEKGNIYICTNSQNTKDVWINKPDMKNRISSGKNFNVTHCKNGHERKICSYVTPMGRRICRKCQSISYKKYFKKKTLAMKKNMV